MIKLNLSAEDLEVGPLYITQQSNVLLYLGKSVKGLHTFYNVSNVPLMTKDSKKYIRHEMAELKFLIPKAHLILTQMPDEEDAILSVNRIPEIIYKVPFLTQQEVCNIYAKKTMMGMSKLKVNFDASLNKKIKRILVKDLIPFHVYVMNDTEVGTPAEGNSGAYIYLGKGKIGYSFLYIMNLSRYVRKEDLDNAISWFGKANVLLYKNMIDLYEPIYYAKIQDWVDFDLLEQKGFI